MLFQIFRIIGIFVSFIFIAVIPIAYNDDNYHTDCTRNTPDEELD